MGGGSRAICDYPDPFRPGPVPALVEVRAEIAELQTRVLEAEAKAVSAADSSDTPIVIDDSLAQGDERFPVRYQLPGPMGLEMYEFNRSWDELFRMVGPIIRDPTMDTMVRSSFQTALAQEAGQFAQAVTVVTPDFNQVMLQLEALGLVAFNAGGRQGWSLTAAGRRKLVGAFAIRSTQVEASSHSGA